MLVLIALAVASAGTIYLSLSGRTILVYLGDIVVKRRRLGKSLDGSEEVGIWWYNAAHIKFHYEEVSIAICNAMLCPAVESHAKRMK